MPNTGFYRWGVFLLALVFSCASYSADDRLVLTGSSTVAPLVLEMAKRFERVHSGVRIDVQTGGSSRGVTDVLTGRSDIGMVSRELKVSEVGLHSYTIALDGISIIVNSENTIQQLSKAQVVGIYTGKVTNWKEVGGQDQPIVVVNKAEGRSTLELFLKYYGLRNSEVKASVIIGDNQQGIKMVAGNKNSVGYVSVGAAEFESDYGTPIKLLPMEGISATVGEIRARRFPLSRPLNLITKVPPEGLTKRFIQFAQSTGVTDLIKDQYLVELAKGQLVSTPETDSVHVN